MEVTYFDDREKLLRDLRGWNERTRREIDHLRASEFIDRPHVRAMVERLEDALRRAEDAIAAEDARVAAQPSRRD